MRRGTGLLAAAIAVCGTALALLPQAAGAQDATRYVYWDNPGTQSIGRATVDGTDVDQHFIANATKQLYGIPLVADRNFLYWANSLHIGRYDLKDGTSDPLWLERKLAYIVQMVVSERYLYFATPSYIGRANLDGTGLVERWFTPPDAPSIPDISGLAMDSRYLYWSDVRNHSIGRVALDGTGANGSFITGVSPSSVAVDGFHLYWGQCSEDCQFFPFSYSIGRADLSGGNVDLDFQPNATSGVRAVAADFDHLFWANSYLCDWSGGGTPQCFGGTIGRSNLDASGYGLPITAENVDAGGCNTSPPQPCGPTSIALTPTETPVCMRSATPPAPPPGGAVLARPLDAGGTEANVVVLPAGVTWTTGDPCHGVAQGADTVMTSPASIAVSPDVALRLTDATHGLSSAWGARQVPVGGATPVLFPGRPDWVTTKVEIVPPTELMSSLGGCPACVFPDGTQITPVTPSPSIAYQGDLHAATLNGATLTGDLDGFDIDEAQLAGATVHDASVNGTDFSLTDLRGTHFTSLTSALPPNFEGVRMGALDGACTVFEDANLLGAELVPQPADLLVPGCATTPAFPSTRVPLDLLHQLIIEDKAPVDFSNSRLVVSGANRDVLKGAALDGITLDEAQFLGVPADLETADFRNGSLVKTHFGLADLTHATFFNVSAAGADFDGGILESASFAGADTDLQNAVFTDANLSNASFQTADISNAVFDQVLAQNTSFDSVKATNARFHGAHIYGDGDAFHEARDLTGADFTGAVLAGSIDGSGGFDFSNATLNGADFDDAQCIACNFSGAKLNGATFSSAYLPGATLTDAPVQSASFDGTWLYCGDTNESRCQTSGGPQWPLALGSAEDYGPVPYTKTTVTLGAWTNVTACPDGNVPGFKGPACDNQMLPSATTHPFGIPVACTAVALDDCPTATSTVYPPQPPPPAKPVPPPPGSPAPLAITATTPPTWANDASGEGYYAGFSDAAVRTVGGSGVPAVFAGTPGQPCASSTAACGDGGQAEGAQLGSPAGLAVDLDGALYIADPVLHRVRRVDPATGVITTVAGNGQACAAPADACGDGGPATAAALGGPTAVWAGPYGELLIADGERGLRKVAPGGRITTLNSGDLGTYDFTGVVSDATGAVFATTRNPDYVVELDADTGKSAPVVGTGTSGYNGTESDGIIPQPLPGTQVQVNQPQSLAVTVTGLVAFADTANHMIRAYQPVAGTVIDLAGTVVNGVPQSGYDGDFNWSDETEFDQPAGVAATGSALYLVADTGNLRVRQIGPAPLDESSPGPNQPGPNPPGPKPPGGGNPPPGPGSQPPAGRFRLSRLHVGRKGVVHFRMRVRSAGRIAVRVRARERGVWPAKRWIVFARERVRVGDPTTVRLHIEPGARGRRFLRRHPTVLRLRVSFTPDGGRPRSAVRPGLVVPSRG